MTRFVSAFLIFQATTRERLDFSSGTGTFANVIPGRFRISSHETWSSADVVYFARSQNRVRRKISLRPQKFELIFPVGLDGELYVAHAVRSPIQRFG